jgi:hypothetical protein
MLLLSNEPRRPLALFLLFNKPHHPLCVVVVRKVRAIEIQVPPLLLRSIAVGVRAVVVALVIRAGVHSDTGQNAANALDDTDHGGCDPGRHRPDRDVVMLLIVHVVGSMVCVMLAMLIRKQRLGHPTFVLGLPCSFLRNGWDARRLPFPHRGSHLLVLNNQ